VLEAVLADDEATAALVGRVVAQGDLDALDAEARRIVRVASALGSPFGVEPIRAALGDVAELETILAELVERGVLGVVRPGPREDETSFETRFVFASALVREAASAMLTDADRAAVVRATDRSARAAPGSRA